MGLSDVEVGRPLRVRSVPPARPAPNWVAVVDSSFEVSLDGRPIPVSLSDLAATMTAMCMMCEGATREQVVDHHAKSVERHGWSVVAVDGTQWTPGWCYTIGLTETFGHPELAVVMCDDRQARRSLTRMVGRVAAGERLVSGYQELSGIGAVACREVAPEQLAGGLIALWPGVADRLAWSMVVPDVLQVDLPFLLCARHKRTDWDLSLDAPVFTEVCRPGEFGFRSGSTRGGARRRSASARGRRGSGDPRNRPSRWAS